MADLTLLSDDELLSGIDKLVLSQRRITARLVALLAEVEERRLHLKQASSSMFDFCTTRLGMSEGEAFRRITAARLSRRFPVVLELIERGALHLSALALLRERLTEENHRELLDQASRKSKREVQALLAGKFPRADAPSMIRKLPSAAEPAPSGGSPALGVGATAQAGEPERCAALELRPLAGRVQVEALSEARYKVQFSAGAALKDKLERAKNLLSHQNPAGDLAVVVERALDLLLADLEKKKLGKTERPRSLCSRAVKPGAVTRAARREVFERDGQRCAFIDDQGRRCPARAFLELDHVQARALGGSGDTANLRVLCHAHNRLHAEQTFGREHVEQQVHLRQRKRSERARENLGILTSSALDETYTKLSKAVIRQGFRASETRGVIEQIRKGQSAVAPTATIEQLLREALRLLTEGRSRVSEPVCKVGTAPSG